MEQTILSLTTEQEEKLAALAETSAMVLSYYWGPGYLRVIPLPEKQANQLAKLLERYKQETERTPGHETEEWRTLHNTKEEDTP